MSLDLVTVSNLRRRLGLVAFFLLGVASLGGQELWETLPRPTGPIADFAGLLDHSSERALDPLLRAANDRLGTPVIVATVPSLQGGQIDDFANRLYERWGIGTRPDNRGVLFLVAVDERQMRIETGYGTEPVLTDLLTSRLIREVARPRFRAGDFNGGITEVLHAIVDTLATEAGVRLEGSRPARSPPSGGSPQNFPLPLLLVVLLFFGFGFLRRRLGLPPRTRSSRHRGGRWGGGFGGGFGGGGGGGGGGGFSGFGGGFSGGGGSSGGW